MAKEITLKQQNYELSFWLSPRLGEEEIEQRLNNIVKDIEQMGGVVTFNQLPQLKQLAYPIKKEKNGYFGYLKFQSSRDKIGELKKKLDFNKDILRYLIIKIEEIVSQRKPVPKKGLLTRRRKSISLMDKKEPKEKINIEELDKKLNEILEK